MTPSQREQLRQAIMAEGIEISKATMVPGPVGDVSARQGGILPMGQGIPRVSHDMVLRAQQAGADNGRLLSESEIRVMLEAALTPSA